MAQYITPLGAARHQYGDRPFGIRLADRLHHLDLIGQTGTGKSTFLLNPALHDAAAGHDLGLIDPHGNLALALHSRLLARLLCHSLRPAVLDELSIDEAKV
jgi:hypothetical protein